jgi:hypothetical protein
MKKKNLFTIIELFFWNSTIRLLSSLVLLAWCSNGKFRWQISRWLAQWPCCLP